MGYLWRSSGVILRMTRQGTPAATTFAGMGRFTTLPAPITELSPMAAPASTVVPAPTHTLFPTEMGLATSIPALR